ncbi:MAG: hypothetical protein JWM41_1686 [Gemmatimonadetes bacterium]|nr:hypothetical protein [Gemmatimonadota bacterium]
MMRRRLSLIAALFSIGACSTTGSTAPLRTEPDRGAAGAPSFTYEHDGRLVPGSGGQAAASTQPLQCSVEAPLFGTALIGASGGILDVGRHRLIIPAGALDRDTWVSGSVAAGSTFRIDFAPHGLQFRKPAGLILDASACTAVPNIVYLDEDGGIAEHIAAIFSNWWHVIAAPIDHFSGYMLEV